MATLRHYFANVLAVACTASLAHAGVELDHFFDQESWEASVGEFTTIDFAGFNNFQVLEGDEFADFGVTLESEIMWILHSSGFENDGEGIRAHESGLWVTFDQEMQWLAADHPGTIMYELYRDGELIAITDDVFGDGLVSFSGIWSPEPFDMARIFRFSGNPVFIDDLHFGPPIPAPGALGVLAIAGLLAPRRRWR